MLNYGAPTRKRRPYKRRKRYVPPRPLPLKVNDVLLMKHQKQGNPIYILKNVSNGQIICNNIYVSNDEQIKMSKEGKFNIKGLQYSRLFHAHKFDPNNKEFVLRLALTIEKQKLKVAQQKNKELVYEQAQQSFDYIEEISSKVSKTLRRDSEGKTDKIVSVYCGGQTIEKVQKYLTTDNNLVWTKVDKGYYQLTMPVDEAREFFATKKVRKKIKFDSNIKLGNRKASSKNITTKTVFMDGYNNSNTVIWKTSVGRKCLKYCYSVNVSR